MTLRFGHNAITNQNKGSVTNQNKGFGSHYCFQCLGFTHLPYQKSVGK